MAEFLEISSWQVLAFVGVAFVAGVVDAIVGGGGLLQMPFLLGNLPTAGTATPLGVNKAVTAIGNVCSATAYWLRNPQTRVDWRSMALSGTTAVAFTMLGALLAASIPLNYFRPIAIVILLTVLWFVVTGRNKTIAQTQSPPRGQSEARLCAVSGGLGLYDGLFGPATGTLLLLSHRRILARSLKDSLGPTKVIQCSMNVGGALVLLWRGTFLWPLIIIMGVASVAGSAIGAKLALARGDKLIRVVLVVAVLATIGKLVYDQMQAVAGGSL
jgi:uncharacterized membrane protein YfcA